MLILLPPSETKRGDGDGPELDLAALSHGELTAPRRTVVSALVKLGRTPRTAARVLELGPSQAFEAQRNAALRTAPTLPAIECYTGVLYDAFDVASLSAQARDNCDRRVAIGSAAFGLLAADDHIPPYRLSAGSRVPALGPLTRFWRPTLRPVLDGASASQLVVDLRSGPYRALAPLPEALTVQVLTERADGTRSVVSHANKATKGLVARALVEARVAPRDTDEVAERLLAAGLRVERSANTSLDVIVDPPAPGPRG